MKTKNRLLLTSAMMLALVAVSGTTATYAWWTTTLSQKASLSQVTAKADASLELVMDEVYNTKLNDEDETIVEATVDLTDVTTPTGTSDFEKAVMNAEKEVDHMVGVAKDGIYADGVGYSISFKATVSMDEIASGLTYNVYLGDGTQNEVLIEEPEGSDNAARMAITVGSNTFIVGNGANGYSDGTNTPVNYENTYRQLTGKITEAESATSTEAFGNERLCLGSLSNGAESLDITFTMWFEGAYTNGGVDTNNDIFEAHLYFYAVRVVPANQG